MPDYMSPPSTLPPGSTVWVYLRDSGGTAQELSVQQQRDEAEHFADRHRLIIRHFFADVARTGTTTVGREAFSNMLDKFSNPEIRPAGLLLWNFARFARELDDASYYKSLIRKNGTIIHSLTDPVPDGEYGRVIELIIDITNAEKSRQTGRDVKRSLESLTEQGFSPGGTPPRCYIAEKVQIGSKRDGAPRIVPRWIPDPRLWKLGKLAWKLRAEGKSYGEIQDATDGRIYRSKSSWNSFFSNESYLGIGKCGNKTFPNHHPALIDKETWDAVQRQRSKHIKHQTSDSSKHPRSIASPFLLSGLIHCSHCGSAMSHRTLKANWRCYICGKKTRQGTSSCPSRQVNARNVEIVVLHTVLTQILTPKYFNVLLKETQERFSDNEKTAAQIAEIQNDLAKAERAIGNLLDALELQGIASAGDRLKEREAERAMLLTKLDTLNKEQASSTLQISPEALKAVLDKWQSQIIEGLKTQDILALRDILRNFISRVDADYDLFRIHYRYPIIDTTPRSSISPIDGAFVEVTLSEISDERIHSIVEIAPHLSLRPRKEKREDIIKPRDQEIYRLHVEEKRTVLSLSQEYGLSKMSIWGICTRVRKYCEAHRAEIMELPGGGGINHQI